jgi:hypothetical protein
MTFCKFKELVPVFVRAGMSQKIPAGFINYYLQKEGPVMPKSFVNEWVRLIRPLFPKNARIEINRGGDVIFRIDWKLRNDPARPYKRSRLIQVTVPEEAIDACTDLRKAGSRFKTLIEDRLSVFHPDHDTPKCGSPPKEVWIVTELDVDE